MTDNSTPQPPTTERTVTLTKDITDPTGDTPLRVPAGTVVKVLEDDADGGLIVETLDGAHSFPVSADEYEVPVNIERMGVGALTESWEPVSEDDARIRLGAYHADMDLAIEHLRQGLTLRTPWAYYRVRRPITVEEELARR